MTQMTGCAHVTYDGILTLMAWKLEGNNHPGTIIHQSDSLEQSWDRPASCDGSHLTEQTLFYQLMLHL